jgi:hypothetical protein
MKRAMRPGVLVFISMVGVLTLAHADTLEDGLRRCAALNEHSQRLSCFDSIVRTLPQLDADRFGMTADIERKRDPVAVQEAKDAVLGGKIAGLRQTSHGEWTFTLDNGQIWVESEAKANVDFALGEDVRIEHGAMSSLWLVADQHRKVRVKRLQ